jgi:hypothetical protein
VNIKKASMLEIKLEDVPALRHILWMAKESIGLLSEKNEEDPVFEKLASAENYLDLAVSCLNFCGGVGDSEWMTAGGFGESFRY